MMQPPFPVPTIVNDGLVVKSTDYFDDHWCKAKIPYVDNHRGILRVFCPFRPWWDMLATTCPPPLVITRGRFPCGCEALEMMFGPPNFQTVYFMENQISRMPS